MILNIWKKKPKEAPTEAIDALNKAEQSLTDAQILAHEAKRIADRLLVSRQENHYAQRIRAAYGLDKR